MLVLLTLTGVFVLGLEENMELVLIEKKDPGNLAEYWLLRSFEHRF